MCIRDRHNPVGRVWKEWELRKIGEICFKYQVTVVSDEIHSEMCIRDSTGSAIAAILSQVKAPEVFVNA